MELGDTGVREHMDQDPKVTLQWALRSLERALQNLDDGWAERRVRRQFHQLLLAIERDARHLVAQRVEDDETERRTAAR
jgi:hypothetical protein